MTHMKITNKFMKRALIGVVRQAQESVDAARSMVQTALRDAVGDSLPEGDLKIEQDGEDLKIELTNPLRHLPFEGDPEDDLPF